VSVQSAELLGAAFRALEGWRCQTGLRPADSPNCDTETANRTIQTGSLTVPADGDKMNFQMAVIVM